MSRQYKDQPFDGNNETAEVIAGVDIDTGLTKLLPIKNGKVDTTATVTGGAGGTSHQDKTGFTEGSDVFTPVGGVVNDTPVVDPTEDQAATLRITPKRAAHANLRNQAGIEIGTSATPVRTDPTGTTTQPVSGTVGVNNFPAVQPVSDNAGSLTVDGSVGVNNLPADYPDTTAQARLLDVRDRIGEISLTPTANTVQDRLKTVVERLDSVVSNTDQLEGYVDQLEGYVDGVEALLIAVRDNADTVEAKLQSLIDQTNELELNTNARPSQKAGRTHKHIVGEDLTVDTTLYTVTLGKTLYITSMVLFCRNSDTVNQGLARIRDGTTTKIPITLSNMLAGASTPSQTLSQSFSEPLQFSTDVNYQEVSGNIVASVTFVGYEEG